MNPSVLAVDPAVESDLHTPTQRTFDEILSHMTEYARQRLLADGMDQSHIVSLTDEEVRILRAIQREIKQARECVEEPISLELFGAIAIEVRRQLGVTLPKPSMADFCY